jgi:L-threonylcarbamoyladenylate synthase
VLQGGGVVAHATEGVWGLACDPDDHQAVAKILWLKNREISQGLILIGHRPEVFADELELISDAVRTKALAAWPGASTYIVPNQGQTPWAQWITGDHEGVAVRVPGHVQARLLCATFGGALVSTSANPSGRKAAESILKVRAYFGRNVDYYLPGELLQPGKPSSIEDLTNGQTVRKRS